MERSKCRSPWRAGKHGAAVAPPPRRRRASTDPSLFRSPIGFFEMPCPALSTRGEKSQNTLRDKPFTAAVAAETRPPHRHSRRGSDRIQPFTRSMFKKAICRGRSAFTALPRVLQGGEGL